MKAFPFAVCGVLLLVATTPAFNQSPPKDDPTAELQVLRGRLETLEREAKQNAAQLVQWQRYVESQAKAAQAMQETLARSEKEGFTYGLNPRSREILLSGWREQLAAMQRDLPTAKPVPSAAR